MFQRLLLNLIWAGANEWLLYNGKAENWWEVSHLVLKLGCIPDV